MEFHHNFARSYVLDYNLDNTNFIDIYIYIIQDVYVKKSPAIKHIQKIPNKQEGIKDFKKNNCHVRLLNKGSIYSECKIGQN